LSDFGEKASREGTSLRVPFRDLGHGIDVQVFTRRGSSATTAAQIIDEELSATRRLPTDAHRRGRRGSSGSSAC